MSICSPSHVNNNTTCEISEATYAVSCCVLLAADSWDGNSSFGANSDRGSDGVGGSTMGTGRRGMFAVLRIEDLGVIGEKGTKVRGLTSPPAILRTRQHNHMGPSVS